MLLLPHQVSFVPAVPGSSGLQRSGNQRDPLQQDHQRVRAGVPDHTRPRPAAETETGRPQREEQDARQDDHGHQHTGERQTTGLPSDCSHSHDGS